MLLLNYTHNNIPIAFRIIYDTPSIIPTFISIAQTTINIPYLSIILNNFFILKSIISPILFHIFLQILFHLST